MSDICPVQGCYGDVEERGFSHDHTRREIGYSGSMKPLLFKLLACLLLTTLIFGCATTAKIDMITGQKLEGNIVGSDDVNVYIGTGFIVEPLKKAEIVKITHPGNGGRIIWSIVAGYGVANIIVGVPTLSEYDEYAGAAAVGVFLPAALGFPMAYRSFKAFSDSKNALNRPYSPPKE